MPDKKTKIKYKELSANKLELFTTDKTNDLVFKGVLTKTPITFIYTFNDLAIRFKNTIREYNFLDENTEDFIFPNIFMPAKQEAKKVFEYIIKNIYSLNFVKEKFKIKNENDMILIIPKDFIIKKKYFNVVKNYENEENIISYIEYANEIFNFLEKKPFEKQYVTLKYFGDNLFLDIGKNISEKGDYFFDKTVKKIKDMEKTFLYILEKEPEKTIKYLKYYIKSANDIKKIKKSNYVKIILNIKDDNISYNYLFKENLIAHLAFLIEEKNIFLKTKKQVMEKFNLKEKKFNYLFKNSIKNFFLENQNIYQMNNFFPKKEITKIIANIKFENLNDGIFDSKVIYDYFKKKEIKNINSLKEFALKDLMINDYILQFIIKKSFLKLKEKKFSKEQKWIKI